MKKLVFIVVLFICVQSFAQKTFEIYNFSSYTVNISSIVTHPTTGGYPEFSNKWYGGFDIAPGNIYVLENTSNVYRFPFYSPTSIPYMTQWQRLNSPSSVTMLPSNNAWVLGNNQVFYRLHVFSDTDYHVKTVLGGVYSDPDWMVDADWTATYDCSNPAPNVWFYTIVIMDN